MNQDNSESNNICSQSQSQLELIPQIGLKKSESNIQEKYTRSGEYIKVISKQQTIDFQEILKDFNNSNNNQKKRTVPTIKKNRNKKPSKVSYKTSKKQCLSIIRKKQKTKIDQLAQDYKQYLLKEKSAYDGKQKENCLNLFRLLIDGIFQLRYYASQSENDITTNQKKIISHDADIFQWVRSLVDKFDKQFKEAQKSNLIQSSKKKWDSLIKNLRDENNFEVRRKIIRYKIKPTDVIKNDDQFLKSQQAKFEQQRRKKLILAQAFKNFDNPLQDESQKQNPESKQILQVEQPLQPLQSLRTISSSTNIQRKISQQKQKIQEYKQFVGQQPINRLRKRINDLLIGTDSYQRIMGDLERKFGVDK